MGDYLIHRDCGVGRFLGVFDKGQIETQDFIAIEYGDGKVFVILLGHNGLSFQTPEFQKVILNGISWITN